VALSPPHEVICRRGQWCDREFQNSSRWKLSIKKDENGLVGIVWVTINDYLKRKVPSCHRFLKRRATGWQRAPAPLLPALRRIRGGFFLVHPSLLTVETDDREPHIYQWILNNLPRGGVFFDVGAHYGWISLKAARHVGRGGRVVAFEPSPILLHILLYHQRYNCLPQMTVVGSAVSETDAARSTFYLLNGGLSSRNSLTIGRPGLPFLDNVEKVTTEVSTIKLDSFCDASGMTPDVIKIDVEGSEGMVLRGAGNILRRFGPALVISTHPYWLPASESAGDLFDFLAGYGYRVSDSRVIQFEGYEIGDYLLAV
jgi:FkbM family methyltransferase